ncbi:MAG: sigma-70 family RNA polymerase sigma factor, partial [Oscillospiraceae bacterium]|nr:sigma-70 family RNA polymerase sigma factor [Oscillospiraceae bacterium]
MRSTHLVESDTALLALLDSDPETGMEELVTRYHGLLWSVAARRLGEPEDIKDCVNETFLEFYAHRDRFVPDKGSLKNYLSAITDRLALKRYWELSRCTVGAPEEMPDCRDSMDCADSRADLESALEQLEPLDAEIIRMKYYGGMTFKEIAASLDIPYETAKKRHQRSLKKLRKSMIIGIVVALMAALLAACAYVVLRYFGVVPGYGVNNDPETGIYILEEPAVLEMEDCTLTITDGWWNDGLLILQYAVEAPGETAGSIWDLLNDLGLRHYTLEGLDSFSYMGDSRSVADGQHAEGEWYARGGLPEGAGDTLELQIMGGISPIPLTLRRAETEVSFNQSGYYDLTEDQGGLLALPRLENGELIVSIYPLNEGDFTIDAGLTKLCGELAPVTVTTGDGMVLTGSPIGWRPFSSAAYFDWNFGPAEPGEYTLTVPYVYEALSEYDSGAGLTVMTTDLVEFFLPVPGRSETRVEFPYGSVTMQPMEPREPYDLCPDRTNPITAALGEIYDRFSWWTMALEWTCTAPDRELANVFISGDGKMVPSIEVMIDGMNTAITPFYLEPQLREVTDPETGWTYQAPGNLLVGCYEGIGEVYAFID